VKGNTLPFTLPSTRDACAITDVATDSAILTGGRFTPFRAARYNLTDLVESLPNMNRARSWHGCGAYRSSGKLVLIVAGGDSASGDTTEKLMIGETSWTVVGNLPRATSTIGGATISMNNKIYIFGTTTDIIEYVVEDEQWKKIGDMQDARWRHAVASIRADPEHLCGLLPPSQTPFPAPSPNPTSPSPTQQPSPQMGVLIVGGWDRLADTTAEVFFPRTGQGCKAPNYALPANVHSTTMDTVGGKTILCGGGGIQKECYEFTPNSPTSSSSVWTKYADLHIKRYEHTSWASSQGPVLVGGYEPYGVNSEKTAELVKGNILPFTLPSTRDACAITDVDGDTTIVTGGQFTQFKATRYNLTGLVETLPDMNQSRATHGCGSYKSDNKLILIVVGGDADGTTEKLIIGESSWTPVGALPKALTWINSATISVDNKIYIFGGHLGQHIADTDIIEYDPDQEAWNKIGELTRGRYRHATAIIEADPLMLCGPR